ncbi:unnamed protein product, partial [Hymenolepis diminuta]
SIATVSHISDENRPQSPVIPLPPIVLSTATPVKAANGNMKLHPKVRNSAKVTNLTHPRKSSMPKVVPARHISDPTVPRQQFILKSFLLDHQTNQICHLKRHKKGCCIFVPPPSP